jgi:hypothetical protein
MSCARARCARWVLVGCLVSVAWGLTLTSAGANGPDYEVDWYSIGAGAGLSAGGSYAMDATMGQPAADELAGGTYAVRSGLWPGISPAWGDCNADRAIDAGDVSALILEVFDGDGSSPGAAGGGSFVGDVDGCNPNRDTLIDAGDLSCTILLIFNGPGSC